MDNIKYIQTDINEICSNLKDNVEGISIFGSFLGKRFEDINDIDIVVFVDKVDKHHIEEILKSLDISTKIDQIDFYNYRSEPIKSKTKNFHLLLWEPSKKNKFLEINDKYYGVRDLMVS